MEERSQQVVPAPVIFRDLPATFPGKDKYKKPSVFGSVLVHAVLILLVLLIPLLLPQAISERELLVTSVRPIGPPPPPPPPALPAAAIPQMTKAQVRPVTPKTLVTPAAIPTQVLKIVEEPIPPPQGVFGGVPGGIPGGTIGGVLSGILASNASENAFTVPAPPPPPPPPPAITEPAKPVRVGGSVREPRPVRVVPPIYPPLASKARIGGTVVLEATITEHGTVDEIRVISGHPLLVEAAIAAVKQWEYEPTLLNGIPVAVILTAKVHFERTRFS